MYQLTVKTQKKRQIVDITDHVAQWLRKEHSDKSVLCQLNVLHTTAALATADLDPGTDLDMLDAFEQMIPRLHYRHPHDPGHVPDHILSTLIGTSLALIATRGELQLGTWQRVILVELDGPRNRDIVIGVVPLV